ncbi:MAG: NUDIX domain-containing protein [Bacilli bacterium]|nr:NUDIX domain-containing protein [Bacilli bacterium]
MGKIIVGGVIKKDNKYLLVQEAQEKCRGKWNIPAGHLDPNETIFEGAKREVFEETGLNVDLTGILRIENRVMTDDEFLGVVFSTNIVGGEIRIDPREILDIKWFTYEEILNMKDELRSDDLIIDAITQAKNNNSIDLGIIQIIK